MWWARLLNNLAAILGNGAAANSYESIATVTVGAGGSSTISFTSIPSTYKHLQIRLFGRQDTGGFDQAHLQFNSDTGNNYATHNLNGNGSTAGAGATTSTNKISISAFPGPNQTSSVFAGSVVDILDYTNTSKYKTTRALSGVDANGSGYVWFASGLWQNTNAVSSITLVCGGNFVQYTSAALYGVK
jgi:hypothetical protein